MAFDPSRVASTKNNHKPPIGVIYGVHGVGKTQFASEFPNPYYVSTLGEEPPDGVDMNGPDESIGCYGDLCAVIDFLLTGDHDHKTLIIDSVDGLEPLVWKETCANNGWKTIEDPGYGKGYVAADEDWRYIVNGLQTLREAGIATILLAHVEIGRFEDPTSNPYSRYNIKLHKRAAAMIQESAQFVGFMNYRHSLKTVEAGFNKKITHAEGSGERQIHFEERPGFLAKNRHNMPTSLLYRKGKGYSEISKYFPEPRGIK